jgi:hypothetical protein
VPVNEEPTARQQAHGLNQTAQRIVASASARRQRLLRRCPARPGIGHAVAAVAVLTRSPLTNTLIRSPGPVRTPAPTGRESADGARPKPAPLTMAPENKYLHS